MEYRQLGRSNLKVSVIGFGGIPVQRGSKEEAKAAVVRAGELGINFIDTAKGYTVSEEFIGDALAGIRENWIIASKSMARDKESMIKDVEDSLAKLKTDYIDLYQFHNISSMADYEKVLAPGGAYEALTELKAAGKIRHIGLTSHSMDILRIAVESDYFESIMYPYNVVVTQASELFVRANQRNIGVIAMKPMAGGNLTNATVAMKFILENTNVTSAIPGMATIEEVEENAAVGNNFVPLTYEEREAALEEADSLGQEFCRRCGYCKPCPQGIDIPSNFLMKNYKLKYDLTDWSEKRYFAMEHRAKDCIECGKCETKCPYKLPIRKMLKEVRKTFNE